MRPVLLATALATLGWIGWSVYQHYTPEGREKDAEWQQVEACRVGVSEGNPDERELQRRAEKCRQLSVAFAAKWR